MPDPRFFRRAGPQSLARLAEIAGAKLSGSSNPNTQIADVATLKNATSADLIFVSDHKYIPELAATKAGACLIDAEISASVPSTCVALICPDARSAFSKILDVFYPDVLSHWPSDGSVASSAEIDTSAVIAPGAVIGAQAKIGARTRLGPHVAIGAGVVIGDDCDIGANVTISFSLVGHRVIVHPGVQIGQDGFGYTAGPKGPVKARQLGRVVIHDDVEIGANSTIDRGMLSDTIIGRGCKFDNLVQIAHNVVMGHGCLVVAQAGIAGSCVIGDGVVIGPQVGIIDHINIGSGAQIAGQSGVSSDVAAKQTVMGYPAKPIRQFWRELATLARLTKRG
ncbi:MAG: UDP-3-O-(3-hydroxymyristoyl)glucosamine N-acyltransferase [Alphaproteobacteria bacterium]|nr:UDP-3-O-(3-hydroxymyristoyl)glucosamine N-acyltransferase [Alphaproteobacteria bacterium]PHY00119.1 MAG: UDP-3-O-(3-hydroxymyristoyl)glucosamine N-acyltransferase [Rhodospirillaceae bacterium]